MSNCSGCPSKCSSVCATGIVTFEMFLDNPDKFRPNLYSQYQYENLSKYGKRVYLDNIKAYNSMCDEAEMPERRIPELHPWKSTSAV